MPLKKLDGGNRDGVRPHRRSKREGSEQLVTRLRILAEQVATREMHPVHNFEDVILFDALERGNPVLVDYDLADWTVNIAFAWARSAVKPGRTNDADERQCGIRVLRR